MAQETVSPIDMARLHEVSMGDEAFLRELVSLFLDDTPRQMQALRQAIASADSGAVHSGAHRLKGAGTNLGARSFSQLCLKLEQLGKRGNLEQAPAVFHDLEAEYARLHEFLTTL